jgi:hypothetical protein
VTHKKSHAIKYRSATQKDGTTAKFYCIKTGQSPTHPMDKCYTLKDCAGNSNGTSIVGLTESPSAKKSTFLLKEGPGRKSLKCLPSSFNKSIRSLLQRALKRPIKPKIILDKSSNSSEEGMSIDHITISTTDKVDSWSEKGTDKTDKDKTYRSMIENLSAITNED